MKLKLFVLFLMALLSKADHTDSDFDSLEAAINNDLRTAAFKERDQYRNPYGTLKFFGLKDNQVVVELSPGGGWYTEILAPYLKKKVSSLLHITIQKLAPIMPDQEQHLIKRLHQIVCSRR